MIYSRLRDCERYLNSRPQSFLYADAGYRITNGLYINISLHEYVLPSPTTRKRNGQMLTLSPRSYLRGIANVNSTESSWTLDPRVEIEKAFDKEGVPRGVGNQVSCEFNLLYRFHSAISKRDAKWTRDFYAELFPGEDPCNISMPKLLQGIKKFEQAIPKDPSKRTFAGLVRQEDGTFNDEDMVRILKESIEDAAGTFAMGS